MTLLEGTFLDAVVHPVGGQSGMYVSRLEVEHDRATIHVGDPEVESLCRGEFDLVNPPDTVQLLDDHERASGLLMSESARLSLFQSWGVGTHRFDPDQTELAASVCVPVPNEGVRGIVLDDGTVLTGPVWLVGGPGVVLRQETEPAVGNKCPGSPDFPAVRVDLVGDPLFVRRQCTDENLFTTPRFITSLTFDDGVDRFTCTPDQFGDVRMAVNNRRAEDTVLRVRPTSEGLVIEAEGTTGRGVRG